MSMDFEDYIVDYPREDDPDLQRKLTLREEFHELRAIKNEEQKPGGFFKHQRIFARYMRYYDRVFNIHETGTGKTGSVIATAEMFKRLKIGIRKVVILFPGKFTLQDFQMQLVKFFPEYDDPDEKVRNKKIKKWYELNTYKAFASEIRTQTVEELRALYSNTFFFLDEIHSQRNYKQTQDIETYETIWSLLHLTKHTKIALGSATPMVNQVDDFIPLINLILPEDKQLSLDDDFSSLSIDALEQILNGKISFVKSAGNKLLIEEVGNSLRTEVQVSISKTPNIRFVKRTFTPQLTMSPEERPDEEDIQPQETGQRRVFSDTKVVVLETEGVQAEVCREKFREINQEFGLNQKYASTFVFPDRSLGREGYNKYMLDKQFRSLPGQQDLNKLFPLDLDNDTKLERLRTMSIKFHFYINNELNSQGNSFCYIEDVRGGGMYLLARLLDRFGFQQFENIPVLSKSGEVDESFPKRPRYALLTSDLETNETLRLFNSKANKNGEYIRLIIASKAARDGINLSNVIRGYVISPLWNDAGMYQALSRFIRATSHQDLIADLKRKEKLKVKIYKLAAYVLPSSSGGILDGEGNINAYSKKQLMLISNDLYIYRLSDTKDVKTRLRLEDMKLTAFDFVLNYNRNYSERNVSGTKSTGYGPKTPVVGEVNTRSIVKNTKRLLYYHDELDKLEARVRHLLTKYQVATLDDLRDMGIDPIYVSIFIKERVPTLNIVDAFGVTRKVLHRNDCLYTNLDTHFMSTEAKRLEIVNVAVEVTSTDLSDFQKQIMESEDMESVIRKKLEENFPNNEASQKLVQRLIESVIIKIRDGNIDPKLRRIYELFQPYVHSVAYPHDAVALATKLFSEPTKGPGRTPKKFALAFIKDHLDQLSKIETNNDITYYHFFQPIYTKPSVPTIFSTVFGITNTKRMARILRRDKTEFEDASRVELPIFQLYYIEKLKEWMSGYMRRAEDDIRAIGSIFRDGNFRISTPETATNKQGGYTGGKVCGDPGEIISNPRLYRNAIRIDFSATPVNELHQELTKKILKDGTIREITEDEILTYLKKNNVSPSADIREQYFQIKLKDKHKSIQCKYLLEYFRLKGFLIRTF